jgi:ATP-binding cassette, subfamily B, bacterial PglK
MYGMLPPPSGTQTIRLLLRRLWRHISFRRRAQFGILLAIMLMASFAEVVSIGAVLPFLGVLTSPERVFSYPAVQPFIQSFGIGSPQELLLPITALFCVAALLSGGMRLMLIWASTRLSFAAGADLSIGIYRRTLYQPYPVHISRNSSEVINGITSKSNSIIFGTISPVLSIIAAGVMLVVILAALLFVSPFLAITSVTGFGAIYVCIALIVRQKLYTNSKKIAKESTNVIKALQEGLGGIRDVLISGTQPTYCDIYLAADRPLRKAQGDNQFIAQCPRYVVEAIGMLLIAVLAYNFAQHENGVARVIPVLGALALGAQRMLPMLQQAYLSWSSIQGSVASLQDTLDLLDQPMPEDADRTGIVPLPFKDRIELKRISFQYRPESPGIIDCVDLTIKKGSRMGFVGTTGSGKSTLLDIVMGLLLPDDGSLAVDGVAVTKENIKEWQAHIAHVPQSIFLADCSIAENIAFGVPKKLIDYDLVQKAAAQAQMDKVIESWPEGYETSVGERGIRLSGGQRQRIGIARALYKQSDVIIFDEATSALDSKTEASIMESLEGLDKGITLLIIAHRVTTLYGCSQIVELEGGEIKRICSYEEIVV